MSWYDAVPNKRFLPYVVKMRDTFPSYRASLEKGTTTTLTIEGEAISVSILFYKHDRGSAIVQHDEEVYKCTTAKFETSLRKEHNIHSKKVEESLSEGFPWKTVEVKSKVLPFTADDGFLDGTGFCYKMDALPKDATPVQLMDRFSFDRLYSAIERIADSPFLPSERGSEIIHLSHHTGNCLDIIQDFIKRTANKEQCIAYYNAIASNHPDMHEGNAFYCPTEEVVYLIDWAPLGAGGAVRNLSVEKKICLYKEFAAIKLHIPPTPMKTPLPVYYDVCLFIVALKYTREDQLKFEKTLFYWREKDEETEVLALLEHYNEEYYYQYKILTLMKHYDHYSKFTGIAKRSEFNKACQEVERITQSDQFKKWYRANKFEGTKFDVLTKDLNQLDLWFADSTSTVEKELEEFESLSEATNLFPDTKLFAIQTHAPDLFETVIQKFAQLLPAEFSEDDLDFSWNMDRSHSLLIGKAAHDKFQAYLKTVDKEGILTLSSFLSNEDQGFFEALQRVYKIEINDTEASLDRVLEMTSDRYFILQNLPEHIKRAYLEFMLSPSKSASRDFARAMRSGGIPDYYKLKWMKQVTKT